MTKYYRKCLVPKCTLKAMTGMKACYAHGPVSKALISMVWRKLHRYPNSKVRDIGEELGTANIMIMRAIQWLDDQGVLVRDRRGVNARHIKIPPIVDNRGHIYAVKWLDL